MKRLFWVFSIILISRGALASHTERVLSTCDDLPNFEEKLRKVRIRQRVCGDDQICTRGILPVAFRVVSRILIITTEVAMVNNSPTILKAETERTVSKNDLQTFQSAELRGASARPEDVRALIRDELEIFYDSKNPCR